MPTTYISNPKGHKMISYLVHAMTWTETGEYQIKHLEKQLMLYLRAHSFW